ncbi:MAG: DUF3097 family protein [Acidimicrobiales bacterium]|nr:DUF3097 family protein [Acidimicrobiales bacterium]
MRDDGVLSGPLNIDAPPRARPSHRPVAAALGMVLVHRASGTEGSLVRFVPGQIVVLRGPGGKDRSFRDADGAFSHQGAPVALRQAPQTADTGPRGRTASGSIDVGPMPARVARASRIYVEGIHDAELVERIWGDDLRVEGVVVEPMDGADDLAAIVRGFRPGPGRRLGILLDHLVDHSKETRLAEAVDHPDVLVTGHPFVDIWQAIKPSAIGIDVWPDVPRGQPWKEGVCAALGWSGPPGRVWKQLLARVSSFRDLEPALVGAVEQLIDFVAPPE